jgi:hypothetical protein
MSNSWCNTIRDRPRWECAVTSIQPTICMLLGQIPIFQSSSITTDFNASCELDVHIRYCIHLGERPYHYCLIQDKMSINTWRKAVLERGEKNKSLIERIVIKTADKSMVFSRQFHTLSSYLVAMLHYMVVRRSVLQSIASSQICDDWLLLAVTCRLRLVDTAVCFHLV